MNIQKSEIKLIPAPEAVITQFLRLPGAGRVQAVIDQIGQCNDFEAEQLLQDVLDEFASRHRNISGIFLDHFQIINEEQNGALASFSDTKKILSGACFTKEYSIQAAALFNPSIVAHPDQSGVAAGTTRFVMSLRATGEGHISSVVFRTGIVNKDNKIMLDRPPKYYTCLKKNESAFYTKDFMLKRANFFNGFEVQIMDELPDSFTAHSALAQLTKSKNLSESWFTVSLAILKAIFDTNYETQKSGFSINEQVIFPSSDTESMGIEDVRFVKFANGHDQKYFGTYTAYDGKTIRSQIIETDDFSVFKMRALYGKAISDKGMALFPEKVNGKYAMLARQGGKDINIMFSDDLYVWNDYQALLQPQFSWEYVQLGNCGCPLKTPEGWLVLMHGVGPVRKYVISALLLDLADPAKVRKRLTQPLIAAGDDEREGYVPNVVYTCGFMQNEDTLVIPYAVSDSATAFATISLNDILTNMT